VLQRRIATCCSNKINAGGGRLPGYNAQGNKLAIKDTDWLYSNKLTIRIVKVGDVNVGAAQLDNEWKDTRWSRVKSERDSCESCEGWTRNGIRRKKEKG
jgi:hypothetical protein